SNNPYQPSSPFMCSLPNGDILFSALNPALISSGVPCSLVKLHSADGRTMLASSGPHVPGLFGAVPGQVCAKFTGLNLLSGTYRVILEFSDRQ
ncbi:hypothetical protein, partial [Klebsiella pneumoniae]|uniref:hypothetical protein n=1 Tax=Klebsiella pneumoniae TaxID=573 RepID=UPI00254C1C3E